MPDEDSDCFCCLWAIFAFIAIISAIIGLAGAAAGFEPGVAAADPAMADLSTVSVFLSPAVGLFCRAFIASNKAVGAGALDALTALAAAAAVGGGAFFLDFFATGEDIAVRAGVVPSPPEQNKGR